MRYLFIACALTILLSLGASRNDSPTSGPDPSGVAVIAAALDDFHDAAAKADGERYFGHFAPDAVFLGTDATERWTLAEFRAFAEPYFKKGTAWTYKPVEGKRHVSIPPDGSFAWFDELLENAKYGTCRGTGVLRKIDDHWRIAQYSLTIPIPNELAVDVVALIKRREAAMKQDVRDRN